MRFKVDANLPRDACDLPNGAGHDAISVGGQGLSGADDSASAPLPYLRRSASSCSCSLLALGSRLTG
jgi:hypothetical protein